MPLLITVDSPKRSRIRYLPKKKKLCPQFIETFAVIKYFNNSKKLTKKQNAKTTRRVHVTLFTLGANTTATAPGLRVVVETL